MRRSILLRVTVVCPHLQRAVAAQRNEATGRLVHCDDNARCRAPAQGQELASAPFPAGCPVYPSLTVHH